MALTPFDGELDAPVSGLAPFTGKLDGEPEGIAGGLRAATESGKAIAGDIGTGLNIGTTVDIPEQVIGINALARAMTPAGILSGMVTPQAAKDVRGKIEGVAREAIDSRRNNLSSEFSPEQQAANKKQFFTDDASWKNLTSDGILSAPGKAIDLASKGELFGEGWSDWRKPVGSAVQSAPSSLLMMTPTALASKTAAQTAIKEAAAAGLAADAAQAAGVKAAERTAMIAGGLSEGAQGAGSAYEQTRRTVLEMPEEKLRSSPFYQEQLAANGGDAKAARAKAAEAAALTSASGAFWFDALFGAIGDKYIGTAAAGKGTRTGALARGAAQETPTEFIQSGGEKLTENLAMKRFADPSQDLMQNVGEEATGGALSGAIMGAGMGAAFHRSAGIAAPGSAPPATPALLPDTGPISRSANIAIQTGAANLAAAAQAADVLGAPPVENNDTLNNQPAETGPVAPNIGPLDTAAAAADPVRAQQTDAANIPTNPVTNVQTGAAASHNDGFINLAAYNITTPDPLKPNDAQLSVDDALFELDVLQARADKGKLTPDAFAQSGIAARLDTAQMMRINEQIKAGDTSFIGALKARIEQSTGSPSAPATPETQKANAAQARVEQAATQQARIKQLQSKLEQADPFTEQSSALTSQLQSAVTQDAQSALNSGEMPVYKVTDHVSVAIHPSAQNPGMVQVTRYTKDGVIGDSQYNNVDDAVRQEGLTHKPRIASNDAVAVIEKSIQAEAEYQQRKNAAPVPNADAGIGVGGKSGIAKGASGIAQRQANAANNFIDSVQEQFGLSKEDAEKAWDHFVKNKLVKIDAVGGQYTLTDGRLWDGDVMRQAASTVNAEKPAETQDSALQNRDRGRAASVNQMQSIARNPDYMRLGPSRTPDSGAPMVFSVGNDHSAIPADSFGASDVAVMSDGQRVPFRYAVVNANLVQPSNFADGMMNPAFSSIKAGTLKALNNGRSAGVIAAHAAGNAGAYVGEMLGDVAHGVSADVIRRTPNPMLIRVYSEEANTDNMAAKSQGQGLGMSASERAAQDAELMTGDVLDKFAPLDIAAAGNRDFVRAFVGKLPENELADMMGATGNLSQDGRRRIEAALLTAAYGKSDLVQELFESTDTDIKAIGNALKVVSGQWAIMRQAAKDGVIDPATDMTANLIEAVNIVRRSRAEGSSVAELAGQGDLMGGNYLNELSELFLRIFYKGAMYDRARGGEKVIAGLQDIVTSAMNTKADAGLFGDSFKPTPKQIVQSARSKIDEKDQPASQSALFGANGQATAISQGNRGESAAQSGEVGQRPIGTNGGEEVGKQAEPVAQQATAPVERKVTTEDARGQQDVFAQAKYTGPADVSSRAGQIELSNRAGTIAALKGMNEQLRKIAPDEAWADRNIDDAQNLDALRDQISQALVDANRGKPDVNPLRKELGELSGQELKDVFSKLNLAGKLMAYEERISALLMEDAAEVRAAISAVTGNPSESTAQPVKATTEAKAVEPAAQSAEQKIRSAFDALPSVSLGVAYPITVEHNGVKREFMVRQDALGRGKIPALHVVAIHQGRMIAADEKSWIAQSYKLNWKNELAEEGLPKKISDQEADEFKANFNGKPAAVDAKKEAETDDGIRYSKVSDAPAGEELVAIHNLSAENVLHAASIGGIPVPSIGITKLSSPFTDFGEITLIADKGMIDPGNSVPVFDRDAYTARFPEFNYKKVTAKKADAFYERMNVARELSDDGRSFISQLWDAVKNARVQSPKKVADLFRTYLAPRMLYAKEVLGKEIKAPMIPIKASVFFGHEKSWRDFVKNNAELKRTDEDAYNAAAAKAIKIAANEVIERKGGDAIRSVLMEQIDRYVKDGVQWGYLDRAIQSAQDFGKKRVDAVALSNRVAKIVPQDDPGYLKWVSNEISDLFVAPTITLRGKEVEASLDNIVEAMTIGKTNGAEKTMTFGVGKTSALLGKRFKSIKEIQGHRNQVVSSSRESDMKKDSEKLLEEYRLKAVEHFTHTDWKGHIDTFAGFDAAMEALAKAGKGALTDGNIASAMRSVGFKNVPSDVINLARQGIVSIREAATDYFEAKPQRAVKLNEFNGAVVPNGTDQEVIDALKASGITDIRTYKRGDAEGRKKSVALLAKKIHAQNKNTLFSNSAKSATQSEPLPRQQAEHLIKSILGDKLGKVMIESGQVMLVDTEQGLKNLPGAKYMVAWHGSPHDHNKFDSSKIGTGEGAQAYGYGLYFAGARDVAEYYRDTLSGPKNRILDRDIKKAMVFDDPMGDGSTWQLGQATGSTARGQLGFGTESFMTVDDMSLKDAYMEARKAGFLSDVENPEFAEVRPEGIVRIDDISKFSPNGNQVIAYDKGKLYQVELAPSEDEYLDWDKPLSEQSDTVKAALSKTNLPVNRVESDASGFYVVDGEGRNEFYKTESAAKEAANSYNDKRGSQIYKYLSDDAIQKAHIGKSGEYVSLPNGFNEQKAASDYLHSIGIRGIRYLDGSSRSNGAYQVTLSIKGKEYSSSKFQTKDQAEDYANEKREEGFSAAVDIDGNRNYVIFSDDDVSITAKYAKENGGILGATLPDGRIVLVLENLNADNFDGVFKHEGVHSVLRETLGEETYQQLEKRFVTLMDMSIGRKERIRLTTGQGEPTKANGTSPGAVKEWFNKAIAAIPKDTKPADYVQEIMGYATEQYTNGAKQPNIITRWVESLLSALRTAIIRRLPFGKLKSWAVNNLQPQDLANLAIAGLKANARGQLQAQGREAMAYSRNENGANVSRMVDKVTVAGTQAPTSAGDGSTGSATIEVDGVLRSTLNSNGKPIHPTREGIRNFWRWFGDSNVLGSNGSPLVVYHGTGSRSEIVREENPEHVKFAKRMKDKYGGKYISTLFNDAERAEMLSLMPKTSLKNIGADLIGKNFDPSLSGDIGIHFGSYDQASHFGKSGAVFPVYLSAKNVIEVPDIFSRNGEYVKVLDALVSAKVIPESKASNIKPLAQKLEKSYQDAEASGMDTREIGTSKDHKDFWKNVSDSIQKNVDALLYKNEVEGHGGISYVVFDPSKIKSAVGNTGSFGNNANPNEPSASAGSDVRFSKINQTDTPAFKKWFGDSKVVDNSFASLLSEPDGIGILLNDLLSAQNASSSGLDPVQALMLALAKNDKIGRGIVGLVPVDVVNSFSKDGFRPKNGGGNTSMFVNALNAPVSDQVLSAFRGVLASLSTKLANAIATGRDQEVAPALFASDFNLREVGGLLSLQGGTDFWSGNTGVKSVGASETAKSASPGLGAPTKNLKLDAAALADLLNQFVSFAPHAKSSISDDLPSAKYIAKQGKPLVVYHGTDADFNVFKPSESGVYGGGVYFTKHAGNASSYGKNNIAAYLSLQNPIVTTRKEAREIMARKGGTQQWAKDARAAGHDGVYVSDEDFYIAFRPEQIKSSTGNNGQFDPNNPNINMSRGTGAGMVLRDLQAVADRAAKGLKNLPRVHVLESPATLSTKDENQKSLRDYIRKAGAWEDVEGATHNGEIYLFASGLADEARAEHVLATHEVTHYGLRGAIGKDLDAALQVVWMNNAAVRKAAAALKVRNGLRSNVEATEEVLADMRAADLVKLSGWRRVVKSVRDWLARIGASKLAARVDAWLKSGLDDQQQADLFVADLVTAARDWVKSGKGRPTMYGTLLADGTLAEDVAKQEKWLTAEARARGYKSIDELAEKNYKAFENLAKLWREKNPADVLLSRAGVQSRHGLPNQPANGTELQALRRAAARLERPRNAVFLRVTEDGRAIATGPKGVRVPETFIRFAQEHDLAFEARRNGEGRSNPTGMPSSFISSKSEAMPAKYRESGAMYFGEGNVFFDRTGKTRFSRNQQAPSQTAAERADKIIQVPVAAWRPVDTIMRTLTHAVRIDALTSGAYDRVARLLDRYTPEAIKAGVISDYGIPEAVLDERTAMQGRMRVQLRKSGELLDKMATLTRAESRVAYEWMNNADPQALSYFEAQLPPESVKVMEEIKAMIDALSQEAVALKQLDPEAFKRNRFEYLRRSYVKHTAELTKGEMDSLRRAIAILGDQYKGRGMTDAVDMAKFKNVAPEWWGRKLQEGKADKGLKGERFIRLERRAPTGEGVMALETAQGPGDTNRQKKGRLLEVAYWPAGEAIPVKYSTWDQSGTWEVVDAKGGELIVWRDFTKQERISMGEIDEARYAIAKTLHSMIHDIETGRYLEWLATTYAKKPGESIDGKVVEASERMRDVFKPGEWVKVPETKVAGTSVAKYGLLAGRYLPGPIWNDVRQTVGFRFKPLGETYAAILGAWKTSKTALSPAVHTNNVMANFVMADWHDVTAGHIVKALRIILGASQRDGRGAIGRTGNVVSRAGIADAEAAREIINRFLDSGANLGSWVTAELQKEQLEPLLKALENEVGTVGQTMAGQVGAMVAVQKALQLRFPSAWDAFKPTRAGQVLTTEAKNMIDLYEAEDQVFRLAAWLRAKEGGSTDALAGKVARRSFLDYHINAPWIQAMRSSALPFISFTYRAVPMMLEVAAKKPHKIMKLALAAAAINALGYLLSGGDEDDERRLLPEEKAGRVWGLVPKLVRMPWNDANNSPVFLDIRRFVPVGDVFDIGQNHAALPLLPVVIPGGPLAVVAELVANRSQFTGRAITLETDTPAEQAEKVADHIYKAFAPNIVILPGTYAWTGVSNAASGRTDSFGREQSPAQATASAFGVKLGSYPKDVLQLNAQRAAQAKIMEIDRNITQLKREYQHNGIDSNAFEQRVESQQNKKRAVLDRLQERMGGN